MKSLTAILLTSATLLGACATTGSESPEGTSISQLRNVEWKIEDIGGQGMIDDSRATLRFDDEGRVSGHGSCNSLGASYMIHGNEMTISQPVMTLRACAPALMDQEGKFVELLKAVRTYRIDETGALILETTDGKRIVARH